MMSKMTDNSFSLIDLYPKHVINSKGEKKLFAIPLATVIGVLENIGFRNMKQMNSMSSKILMNIL